jgi:dTDP-4-dehydrorhamnose reductase
MYCSSNAVFKGDDAPYSETDIMGSVNTYGFMKVTAEQDVDNLLHYQIVRPIMLYGWPYKSGRGNWVTFVTESLKANKPIRVVDDVTTQPTYAMHCARIMWHILDREQPGIWHVAGEETMSLWEFARMIAHVWGYDREMVQAIRSDDHMLKDTAPRPIDPTYCLDKLHSINMHASARTIDGLRRMWNE